MTLCPLYVVGFGHKFKAKERIPGNPSCGARRFQYPNTDDNPIGALTHTQNQLHERGFTLLELIVATTILSILMLMALPLARVTTQREKERRLRHALWEMRDAIDRYKDSADRAMFQIKADSNGHPPDLDTLYKGIEVQGRKKYRFLRSIPTDPMTNGKEWGLRSMQDDRDSDSWGGQNVFDVYTKSEGHRAGWNEVQGLVGCIAGLP